jgi:LmbE family N-acetylglucosaminyl deacetylase
MPSSRIQNEYARSGEKLSLLAIFADPEDQAFGPAGTLAKYAAEGIAVSLVTTTRERLPTPPSAPRPFYAEVLIRARERICACRTSGIRRTCLLDYPSGTFDAARKVLLEARLVRAIREIQPQVVITYGPHGSGGDADHVLVGEVVMRAVQSAGDESRYPEHFQEGLVPHAPRKLYYTVLPSSVLEKWGLHDIVGVADEEVTTVLDVSPYARQVNTLCWQHHPTRADVWLAEERRIVWETEYFALAWSSLTRHRQREKDLFAGLR